MDTTVKFLLEQKLQHWRTIGEVTMIWWVSAIVLCISILGGFWINRDKIDKTIHVHIAGIAVTIFFSMVFAYGVLVILYIPKLEADINILLAKLGQKENPFDSEIWFFRSAMYTGTLDYIVILAVWILMWIYVYKRIKTRIK